MILYLRIFNFLWRAKRMDYCLTGIWKRQMTDYRLLIANVPGTVQTRPFKPSKCSHPQWGTYCMPSYITYLPAHSTHVYPSIRSDVCQRFCAVFHAMNAIDCLLCPSFPRPSFFLFRGNTHAQVLGVLWCVLASISPFLIGLYLYCLLVFSLHCSRNIAHPAPVPHAGS